MLEKVHSVVKIHLGQVMDAFETALIIYQEASRLFA